MSLNEVTKPLFERLNLTGKQFGRLKVIERHHYTRRSDGGTLWYWRCVCSCGNEKYAATPKLTSGELQSCGCLRKERAFKQVPFLAEINADPLWQQNDLYQLYKQRDHQLELTKQELFDFSQMVCHYCGEPPKNIITNPYRNRKPFTYNGLDRVDNTLGYTKSNVVPCCKMCNIAKNNHTVEEFKNWIKKVYNKTWNQK